MKLVSALHLCLVLVFPIFFTSCSTTEKLPGLTPDAAILAFGDSLTAGTGAGVDESYPSVLARISGRKVINAGIPGEISAEGLARLPEVLEREKPALMILCHCANDLLRHMDQRQAADNLRAMIRLARERGVSVVLVAVPLPDLSLTPPSFYNEVAKEFGIPCENKIFPRILGKRSLKSDYIHPNAAGYRQLAEALAELLMKSGALP
ncbi:MAG TPA: arylesterase [Desulfuromonadaceae bacterium]|jgi:lysophospholipase L1-like esterase